MVQKICEILVVSHDVCMKCVKCIMGENASAQAQTRVVELSINFRYLINERPVQCTVRDPAVRGLAVPRMGQSFSESLISFSYRIHGFIMGHWSS